MIVGVLLCIIITFVCQWLMPAWWWIMIVPFLWCLWKANSGWRGFVVGTLSAGLLWLAGSLFYGTTSADLISHRVASMIGLGSPGLLVVVTVLIAAVAGGLAGCTGGLFRAALRLIK